MLLLLYVCVGGRGGGGTGTDARTERRAETETDRQTGRQAGRQANRQTETKRDNFKCIFLKQRSRCVEDKVSFYAHVN